MEFVIKNKIDKLSKMYNYFDSKKAINIISEMTIEEARIVLLDKSVQDAIFKISDRDTLREIFRKSPDFFQEIMFSNEKTQEILISPRKNLKFKDLIRLYNKDIDFSEKEIRELDVFLSTIKSKKVCDDLIENKYFKMIVVLFCEKKLRPSFFRNIDVDKLFFSIINDDIFKTKTSRKRAIINEFNKISDHILLPNDYQKILSNQPGFMEYKKYICRDLDKVYIDDNILSILTTPMIEVLLKFKNVDLEYIENYVKKDVLPKIINNNYDFNKIFPNLLTGGYECFNEIDFIYFNEIIENMESDIELKERFIDFIYNVICSNNDFNEQEENMIKSSLYNKLKNKEIRKEDYKSLFYSPNKLKTIFYLKFGKVSDRMDYLNGIDIKQIMRLNIKHINQILKKINIENEDELSNIYSYAIKLYMVFGLERSLKILNKDYGSLDRIFFDNISKLNVSNVELIKEGKKYIPKISNEFINFMFSKENENHFKDMLNDKSSLLYKNWNYLYNNFDEIKEKCHGNITLKKVNIILKELSPARELGDISPNNYKLKENDILNDICLGNKTIYTNQEIYKTVLDIYQKMKCRIESSIPYIKGSASNGYTYEMMKLNDPIIFTLGYKGNCCIRVNDIAHKHLLHSALCRNGRILLIYDENHELASFVPLKRNGEVLIANSIECLHKIRNPKAIEAFEDAVKDIIKTSEENEEEPIKLFLIGSGAYAKPNGEKFPNYIKTPTIYEKNDPIYENTDSYHLRLDIIYKNPSLDLFNIKYGDPNISYKDPRESINYCDFKTSDRDSIENALKIIDSIRYENASIEELENFRLCPKYLIDKCVYNEDWYIVITINNEIYGDFLNFNPKAEIEYKVVFQELTDIDYESYQEKNGKEKKLSFKRYI